MIDIKRKTFLKGYYYSLKSVTKNFSLKLVTTFLPKYKENESIASLTNKLMFSHEISCWKNESTSFIMQRKTQTLVSILSSTSNKPCKKNAGVPCYTNKIKKVISPGR